MDETQRHRSAEWARRRKVTLSLGVGLLLAVGAVALAAGLARVSDTSVADVRDDDTPGVRFDEVDDAESGSRYLAETIALYLRDGEAAGIFGFMRVPLANVVVFQKSLGISELAWETNTSETAIVLTWVPSSDIEFLVPGPRPGVDATVQADAFVIIIEPEAGLEIQTFATATALEGLRARAIGERPYAAVTSAGVVYGPCRAGFVVFSRDLVRAAWCSFRLGIL